MQQLVEIRPHPASFVLFGKDKQSSKWFVLYFDSQMRKEERIAEMEKREYASYSVIGESIFVVGGGTAQQRTSKCVEEFLMRERRWRRRAPLTVGREYHAAAVVRAGDNKTLLGVFGGNNPGHLSSCEVYDVSQDR
ncbi:unnamed protein product [Dibothriocephalus latus]|uniref:Uncharacterized protein n=1 Tax=Dibothriocephalus latus TaxID=60516 RepID=A0A3P7LPE4_DIBLA|nr:unnamed protein product [Dibothriocephalus latus]